MLIPVLIAIILLFVIFKGSTSNNKTANFDSAGNNSIRRLKLSDQAQASLSLMPNPLNLAENQNGGIDVVMDTKNNLVTGIQLEINYDPQAVIVSDLRPGTLFIHPVQLKKIIDNKKGRITYMLGISPTDKPIKAKGLAAQITLSKTANTQLKNTNIVLRPDSLISATGVDQSVLKSRYNTEVILSE